MTLNGTKRSVLVVDDDRRYRDLLEMNLCRRGFRTSLAESGLCALNALERDRPHLVLLDLSLPDMDGFEVCRRIREYSSVPIVMLTARADEVQKVRGLRLGADDYVTKPFSMEELLARIDAVLRRSLQTATCGPGDSRVAVVVGALSLDPAQRAAVLNGQSLDLTPTEYRLLEELAFNAGRVLVHEHLLRAVWGDAETGVVSILHTAVRRLRRKLGEGPERFTLIETRRGIGYVMPARTAVRRLSESARRPSFP